MAKEMDWDLDGEDTVVVEAYVNPQEQDTYWQQAHAGEQYFRRELGYEDYAPAYCVGYIGYAQYGGNGGTYDDAEKSLCANWVRIKGDARLSYDEARLAMRAAWDRAAAQAAAR
ncbi:hypothetical protein [Ramlibacter sp.]|uniref:hypothetical protein n=1 Tax=Ramlibacter sp. TaxID=1917967 RepID=UPI003D12EC62